MLCYTMLYYAQRNGECSEGVRGGGQHTCAHSEDGDASGRAELCECRERGSPPV
jgi:hypothetical protein